VGPLFEGDAGDQLAAAFQVPLIGRLPFAPRGRPAPPAAVESLLRKFVEVLP
jgi:hypothetical protein